MRAVPADPLRLPVGRSRKNEIALALAPEFATLHRGQVSVAAIPLVPVALSQQSAAMPQEHANCVCPNAREFPESPVPGKAHRSGAARGEQRSAPDPKR